MCFINRDTGRYIKKASSIIEFVNLTEEERNVLSTLERLEANEQAERYYLFTEGKAEGKAEVAVKMLRMKMPIEDVVEITGLPREGVESLLKTVTTAN